MREKKAEDADAKLKRWSEEHGFTVREEHAVTIESKFELARSALATAAARNARPTLAPLGPATSPVAATRTLAPIRRSPANINHDRPKSSPERLVVGDLRGRHSPVQMSAMRPQDVRTEGIPQRITGETAQGKYLMKRAGGRGTGTKFFRRHW
jgi:hypothetical protein